MSSKKHKTAVKKMAIKCRDYVRKEIFIKKLELIEVQERLAKQGLEYSTQSISGINRRGVFSLWYFLAICKALGINEINVDEILGD